MEVKYPIQTVSESDMKIGDKPHFKSVVLFEPHGRITYHGRYHDYSPNQKSKLYKSRMFEEAPRILEHVYGYTQTTFYGPPMMQAVKRDGQWISPYNRGFRKLAAITPFHIDLKKMEDVVDFLTEHLFDQLTERGVFQMYPYTLSSVINGDKNDAFLRRIDVSKAGGFGYPGKKDQYFTRTVIDGMVVDEPNEKLCDDLSDLYTRYTESESSGSVFIACLKDEPRETKKCYEGNTRVFYSSQLPYLLLQKQYLGPLYTCMIQYCEAFYCAIGTDAHRGMDRIYDRLANFSNQIIEGDYSGYDTSMPFPVGNAAAEIEYRLLKKFGYDDDQLKIVAGILSDSLHVNIDFMGDMITVPGLQPSGKYGTAEDNCIRNLVLLVYAWVHLGKPVETFFDHVMPVTYGDDLLAAVRDAAIFNACSYSAVCRNVYDMGFTTASKSEVTAEYILPSEMSFLKRKFVFHEKLQKIVGPLEMDSICKTLQWRQPSPHVSDYVHEESILESCLRELFFHSTERQYNIIYACFQSYMEQQFEHVGSLSNYDALYASLSGEVDEKEDNVLRAFTEADVRRVDRDVLDDEDDMDDDDFEFTVEQQVSMASTFMWMLTLVLVLISRLYVPHETLYWEADSVGLPTRVFCKFLAEVKYTPELCLSRHNVSEQWLANDTLIRELSDRLQQKLSEYEEKQDAFPGWSERQLLKRVSRHNHAYRRSLQAKRLEGEIKAIEMTIKKLSSTRHGHDMAMVESDQESKVENVSVGSGDTPLEEGDHPVAMQEVGQKNLLSLDDFFSRPVDISTLSISPGSTTTYSIDIWDAYLRHGAVTAKTRNYGFFRGTLCIRIDMSGSPFHYGKFLYSYQPKADWNESLNYLDGQLLGSAREAALCYLSQAKISGVIDANDNQPIIIRCPFINQQPMCRLFNKSPLIISTATPLNDFVGFGRLYIVSLNDLQSASTTPSNVSVNIYAWAEDVELGAPTGTIMEVETESDTVVRVPNSPQAPDIHHFDAPEREALLEFGRRELDEIRRSSAILRANTEADEREVGPVEHVASSIAKISGYFTSIPVIEPFAKASEVIFGAGARVASLFGWSAPVMNTEPMYVKNQPFTNGAHMIQYNTGKRITLDPKQELTIDPRIMEGSGEDEMSIAYICSRLSYLAKFPWDTADAAFGSSIWSVPITPRLMQSISIGAPDPYLAAPTSLAFAASFFEYWRGDITFKFQIVASQFHRGKLAFIFEPNISQFAAIDTDLDLNKQYVYICDIQETMEFELTVPWAFPKAWARNIDNDMLTTVGSIGYLGEAFFDYANGYLAVVPFTSLQSPDGSNVEVNVWIKSDNMHFNQLVRSRLPVERPTTESNVIMKSDHMKFADLNHSSASDAHISELHFGEEPISFRALMKRYTGLNEPIPLSGSLLEPAFAVMAPIFPPPAPAYSGVTYDGTPTIFQQLRYAYLGMRGGMRYRVGMIGPISVGNLGRTKIALGVPTSTEITPSCVTTSATIFLNNYLEGAVEFMVATNGGIEFELPFYSNNLWVYAFNSEIAPTGDTNVSDLFSRLWQMLTPYEASTLVDVAAQIDFCTGEDFGFLYYNGAPPFLHS
jgi:hypothetical protein